MNARNTVHPVEIARSLQPLLAEFAAEAEENGRASEVVIEAIRKAGLFSIMFPKRAGGVGNKLITHIETVAELGKTCPGTAWAYGLLSGVTASAASLPKATKDKIFITGDELVCSVAAQTGSCTPDGEFYRVSGRWGYASGCMHADWALNGVKILNADGDIIDVGFAIIPLKTSSHVRIENTWHVAGVCGSGSNTIIAEDQLIPSELVLSFSKLRANLKDNPAALAALEARDKWPVEPLFPLGVLSPMLGAASAILDHVQNGMCQRPIIGWSYDSQSHSQVFVQQLGEAAMEIESAWLHIRRAASEIDETAQSRQLTGYEKARIQADCGYAMRILRNAGERLMDIAGPAAFANSSPLQRFWRDLNVGTRHTALNTRLSLELYGRARLEQESNLALLPNIQKE